MASSAEARWLKAETDRFVVYGDGSEKAVRAFASKLTAFDTLLRVYNPAAKPASPTKVQVFLLSGVSDLKRVRANLPKYTQGFYAATNEGIFAFAVDNGDMGQDDVLFHEYAHHFMLENFPTAYPAWFVEGWAEYFMTAEIKGATMTVGGYNPARAYGILSENWLPLEQVLSKTTFEIAPERRNVFYAQSWLLAHYMLSDAARAKQLDKAIKDISRGAAPIAAMEGATGASLKDLTAKLRAYRRLQTVEITLKEAPASEIRVSQLPPSADDLLLANQRLVMAALGDNDRGFLEDVRRKAARHPGDWLAERTLARAEFVLGDVAAGEAIMKRRLAASPDDREDLLLAGVGQIWAGARTPAEREMRYRAARPMLGKAFQLDKSDFRALTAYALSRTTEPAYPSENDVNVLLEARGLAPSVSETSVRAGVALARKGRRDEAERVLAVVLNNPHSGPAAAELRKLLDDGKLGQVDVTAAQKPAEEEEPAAPQEPAKASARN
ncbi:MAG: hypothetical protein AB1942_06670 [Pseudomonadota bacterium]